MEESIVTFERSWVLVFLLLPLAWMVYEWRTTRRLTALILKTLAFVAIIVALAEPVFVWFAAAFIPPKGARSLTVIRGNVPCLVAVGACWLCARRLAGIPSCVMSKPWLGVLYPSIW